MFRRRILDREVAGMKSNHRSPIWPYLGILSCLLALSITAPRAWQRAASVSSAADRFATLTDDSEFSIAAVEPEPATIVAAAAPVAEPTSNTPATVRVSSPDERLAMAPRRPAPQPRRPIRTVPQASRPPQPTKPSLWSPPRALLNDLEELSEIDQVKIWAVAVRHNLEDLAKLQAIDPKATLLLDDLENQTERLGRFLAKLDPSRPDEQRLRSRLTHTLYSLRKRLDLWLPIHAAQPGGASEVQDEAHSAPQVAQLDKPLAQVAALVEDTPQAGAWRDYLMLDALRELDTPGQQVDPRERKIVAHEVLERISRARRGEARQFVSEGPVAALDRALRRWSAEPVSARDLLRAIELYELNSSAAAGRTVATAAGSLAYSGNADERELAARIEQHYRNANVRIAISAAMLNRLMPRPPVTEQPVYDQILGADVQGTSRARTRLAVRLTPDRGRWNFDLQANGLVDSDTESSRGPVRFYTDGQTSYVATKRVTVGADGVRVAPAAVYVSTDTDLRGFDTDYDGVPLIRGLVRGIARSKHDQMQPQALAIADAKARGAISHHFDGEVDAQMAKAEADFQRRVWDRLVRLKLEPMALDLQTTAERMVVRMRLADHDQLGGHTPRPRAWSNSLLSVQVHESAINNLVDSLELDGRTLNPVELYELVGQRLEFTPEIPADLPRDATITFAARDAVQTQLIDGQVQIKLSIAQIAQPGRTIRNFQVIIAYLPAMSGMKIQLQRDPTIQLIGAQRQGFGARIALRGVFAKMFPKSRPIEVDLQEVFDQPRLTRLSGVEISQLVMDEGWLGLALGPARVER
jgi:hypothetical protein